MRNIFMALLVVLGTNAMAQSPVTNIYLFDVDESNYDLYNPTFVTSDNPNSYNNQPQFINDRLYFSSDRGKGTMDIFAYDFRDGVVMQVTDTKKSEFSPTLMPGGLSISTVCIEDDGKTQRLWQFPLSQNGEQTLVMSDVYNVGYHAWLGRNKVALFVVGDPHTLQMVDTKTQSSQVLASDIGRALQVFDNELYFIAKNIEGSSRIRKLDPFDMQLSTIAYALPDSEDFIVLEDGTLLMGSGQRLYKLKPYEDKSWVEIADLTKLGISKITRLAYSKGKLALVGEN